MQIQGKNELTTDVLVVGGGGAGLRAAIEAAKSGAKVMMAAKGRIGYACNTSISGGGVATSAEPGDSPHIHLHDTLVGGRFINDAELAAVVTEQTSGQVKDLTDMGAGLVQQNGRLTVLKRPGHSYARGTATEHRTGADMTLPLRKHALKLGVKFLEEVWITHLLVGDKAVVGAVGIDRQANAVIIRSKATILATGGAGCIYRNNSNAGGTAGDGYALGYDLGLELRDMEFVQFYPTALVPLGRRICFFETLVVLLGATIRNASGEDIAEKHGIKDPALMTRDKLSQAIFREILEGRGTGGGVIMDLSTIPAGKVKEAEKLPVWSQIKGPQVVVTPTCHFFMGGLRIDRQGWTGRPGLWAAGEVCGGVHGANRLAGNALAEIFVFGAITGREAGQWAAKTTLAEPETTSLKNALDYLKSAAASEGKESEGELRKELQSTMWSHAGIIRDEKGLQVTIHNLSSLTGNLGNLKVNEPRDLLRVIELRNMLLVSEMICRAGLMRTESRGSHFRDDYPAEDDTRWLKNIFISQRNGKMQLEPRPVKRTGELHESV